MLKAVTDWIWTVWGNEVETNSPICGVVQIKVEERK